MTLVDDVGFVHMSLVDDVEELGSGGATEKAIIPVLNCTPRSYPK